MDIAQVIRDLQVGGFFSLATVREGQVETPLYYHASDRAYVVLEGAIQITCNGGVCIANPGTYIYIPAGRWHTRSIGETGCRYLVAIRS